MSGGYEKYGIHEKREAVLMYEEGVRGHGAKAVAAYWHLSDPKLVKIWARQYDGTDESLEKKHAGGQKRKLTMEDSEEHVKKFIVDRNREGKAVSYADVKKEVKEQTGKDVALSTISRYGFKDHHITDKMTSRKLAIEGITLFFIPIRELPLTLGCVGVDFSIREEGILGRYRKHATDASSSGYRSTDLHRSEPNQAQLGSGPRSLRGRHACLCRGQDCTTVGTEDRLHGRGVWRRTVGARYQDA